MTRKHRITQMKKQLTALSKGQMKSWMSDDIPEEVAEEFLKGVLEFETAPKTTHFEQLGRAGVALVAPDQVSDAELHARLWTVIHGLASLGVYLNWTDHLSDRELYTVLWNDVLREDVPMLPEASRGAWHVDLPGDDPDSRLYLTYYAREDDRKHWLEDFPDYDMPAHADPPYARDRLLPRPADLPDTDTRH
jgi:hypothetical protein